MKEERLKIVEIDLKIANLLCERFHLCYIIGEKKKKEKKDIIDLKVKEQRKNIYKKILGSYGESIYEEIHEQSIIIQNTKQHLKLKL